MLLDVPLSTRLEGDVRLRTLTVQDSARFAAHIASDLARLSLFLPWPARTADVAGAERLLIDYDQHLDGRELMGGVEVQGKLVAGVVLFRHEPLSRAVELGCWCLAEAEGKGVVRAACIEALRLARADLGVERVVWQTDPRNTRSRALAERLGFQFEGTLRSSYVLRGERRDTEVLSLVGAEIDAAIA